MNTKTKQLIIRLSKTTLVIIMLLTMLNPFAVNFVYADDDDDDSTGITEIDEMQQNKAVAKVINGFTTALTGMAGLILYPVKLVFAGVGLIAQSLMSAVYIGFDQTANWVGLEDIIFAGATKSGDFLSVNFFNFNTDNTTIKTLRENIAKWYYVLRLISLAILLVILIYVGIRMALSTIAEEQARYKKMLVDWATSLALLFLLHYIVLFVVTVNESLVKALWGLVDNEGLTGDMMKTIAKRIFRPGFIGILCTAFYCLWVGRTLSFFVLYMRRMITVGFLIMISPLITITYSIDKMGDGKAQALNTWLKELSYNILIQPFHCVIYLAFFGTIANLIDNTGFNLMPYVFAIIILMFMKQAEDILRKIFHFEASSMSSISEAGQSWMNATGRFMNMGAKAGSAFANFQAAGGMSAVKDNLKNLRSNSKERNLLRKEFRENREKYSSSSFREFRQSTESREALKNIQETNAAQMKEKAEERKQRKARRIYDRKHGKGSFDERIKQSVEADYGPGAYDNLKKAAETDPNAKKLLNGYRNKESGEILAAHQRDVDGRTSTKVIRGVSNLGQKTFTNMRNFAESDIGKLTGAFLKDSMIYGATLGAGAIALGASDQWNDAYSAGSAMYGFTNAMLTNSSGTIVSDATNYAEKLIAVTGADPSEIPDIFAEAKAEKAAGMYKEMDKKEKDFLDELSKLLGGSTKEAQQLLRNLKLDTLKDNRALDIDALVDNLKNLDGRDRQKAIDLTANFSKLFTKSMIANTVDTAENSGMIVESLSDRVEKKVIRRERVVERAENIDVRVNVNNRTNGRQTTTTATATATGTNNTSSSTSSTTTTNSNNNNNSNNGQNTNNQP